MLELPDRKKRGRSQRRFTDVVKEVIQRVGEMEAGDAQWQPLKGATGRCYFSVQSLYLLFI